MPLQVYEFNVPTFGKGVVFDVDHKVRVGCAFCSALTCMVCVSWFWILIEKMHDAGPGRAVQILCRGPEVGEAKALRAVLRARGTGAVLQALQHQYKAWQIWAERLSPKRLSGKFPEVWSFGAGLLCQVGGRGRSWFRQDLLWAHHPDSLKDAHGYAPQPTHKQELQQNTGPCWPPSLLQRA